MTKHLVRFTTRDGDYDKEWTCADSEDETAEKIMSEHWNIKSIDLVSKL